MTELSPEIQAQLEEQKKNCIFCQIIEGKIETNKVYEDNIITAMLDIRPAVKGHLLVMPKEHYPIMPLLPPQTFKHMFGLLPQIVDMVKKAMVMTGADIVIANGGVAGQQSPHFLFHTLGRDNEDGIMEYMFFAKKLPEEEQKKALEMLKHNFPLMMANHFKKNPAIWHKGKGESPDYLAETRKNPIIYEDEKVLVAASPTPQSIGHLEIHSKEEEKYFENLSYESAAHLFNAASLAATLIFEGLKAQGTNIILKTGNCADNPHSKLTIHVIARNQDDELDLMLKPSSTHFDTADILSSYADYSHNIKEPEISSGKTDETDEISHAIKQARRQA